MLRRLLPLMDRLKADATLSRRQLLVDAARNLTVLTLGGSIMIAAPELVVPSKPLVLTGKPLLVPVPGLTRMTDPSGRGFQVVRDPLDPTRLMVRNQNFSGYAEHHETMGTYRDLPVGSISYSVFGWLYRQGEFEQTARNLVWQNQQAQSPMAAVSTDRSTDNWALVDRINGAEHRHVFGKIPWNHKAYFAVGVHEADKGGIVEAWWAIDHLPDVSKPPAFHFEGDTYQGIIGHNTIGEYAEHTSNVVGAKVYTGYFDVFTRAATAARAVELARLVLASGNLAA